MAGRPWPLRYILVMAALCAASYGVLNTSARYAPAPATATSEVAPPAQLRAWQHPRSGLAFSREAGHPIARLLPRREGRVASLQTAIAPPPGIDALRITLKLGAEAIRPGPAPWRTARVQLLGFDRAGTLLWYWPNEVATLSGDRPFRTVTAVVPIEADIERAVLLIYNGADSGVLQVGLPEVVALTERPAFPFMKGVLVLAWVLAGLWIARALTRRVASLPRAAVLLALLAFLLAGTLTPQPVFRKMTTPLKNVALSVADTTTVHLRRYLRSGSPAVPPVPAKDPAQDPAEALAKSQPETRADAAGAASGTNDARAVPPHSYPVNFKQLGHFSLFFLLGLAGFAAFPKASWAGRLACLASLAATSECLQWFVITRSSNFSDLAADLVGVVLAAAVVAAISGLKAAAGLRNPDRAAPGGPP